MGLMRWLRSGEVIDLVTRKRRSGVRASLRKASIAVGNEQGCLRLGVGCFEGDPIACGGPLFSETGVKMALTRPLLLGPKTRVYDVSVNFVGMRSLHSTIVSLGRRSTYIDIHPNKDWTPPRTLKYDAPELPEELIHPGNHFSRPRGGVDHLPFRVFRTAQRNLPIYGTKTGNGRHYTRLRRFRGDVEELVREMSKVCENKPIAIHQGSLRVSGNHRQQLIAWLKRIGF